MGTRWVTYMSDRNPQYAVRLPKDVAERFEQYCEEQDISYAEGLRRFTQRELEIEEGNLVRIEVQEPASEDNEVKEVRRSGGPPKTERNLIVSTSLLAIWGILRGRIPEPLNTAVGIVLLGFLVYTGYPYWDNADHAIRWNLEGPK